MIKRSLTAHLKGKTLMNSYDNPDDVLIPRANSQLASHHLIITTLEHYLERIISTRIKRYHSYNRH